MTTEDLTAVAREAITRLEPLPADPDQVEELFTRIARRCHEANREYCASIGDTSQVPWDEAPAWQRSSARNEVLKIASGEIVAPGESHVSWMEEKLAQGWTYGEVKDAEAKTHPCLVPFAQLPREQQYKDFLFYEVACQELEARGWTRHTEKVDTGGARSFDADGQEIGQ